MSHFTKSTWKIKDLPTLKRALAMLNLQFTEQAKYVSKYGGAIDCAGVITEIGQEATPTYGAAVVKDGDHYNVVLDYYDNPIGGILGRNCGKLAKTYTEIVVSEELMNQGYIMTEKKVDPATQELVLVYQN